MHYFGFNRTEPKMAEAGDSWQDHLTAEKVAADLAKLLALHARGAPSKEEAAMLWQMAQRCQAEVAKSDSGMMPDIGDPPACLKDYLSWKAN
jgi:hypothetical protein